MQCKVVDVVLFVEEIVWVEVKGDFVFDLFLCEVKFQVVVRLQLWLVSDIYFVCKVFIDEVIFQLEKLLLVICCVVIDFLVVLVVYFCECVQCLSFIEVGYIVGKGIFLGIVIFDGFFKFIFFVCQVDVGEVYFVVGVVK